ncbi:MAG: ASKHA domain-containing protein [Oscillospiraceae bacterium]|nr:ASKHA domain-containing protein [Oscillospiraceae bacterium]
MTPIIRIYRAGELIRETEGVPGETLLKQITDAGEFLDAPCGGKGRCGKCLVHIGSPDGQAVLACQTRVDGDLDVHLPDKMVMTIADSGIIESGKLKIENERGLARRLGVAVDIGTTSVVAHLTDLETCARIATASGVNAQRQYGADVISRIQYCAEHGHEALTAAVQDQLASLIQETLSAAGAKSDSVEYISIAANTIMQHLAAGYSPVGMGTAPFTTVSLFGEDLPAWTGLPVAPGAKIYYAPAISAYVGGDITAGMLAAGLEDTQGPVVFIDVGTNGEIALKHDDTYYCCATAAGPAFEGAEITMGMAAIPGAIDHVKWDNGLKVSVIGDASARGLCGSGLLDALATLLETGAVDETGRMLDADEIEHGISAHIATGHDGKNVFRLTENVIMSAADVRKLQLAKSAIAAGIQVLLLHSGVAEADIEAFILAGGFGSFMDQNSAARIGLFPEAFLPLTKTMGNTAGEGAAIALCSAAARQTLSRIRERCEYIELSTSQAFNDQFVEQMMFPE